MTVRERNVPVNLRFLLCLRINRERLLL